MPKWKQLESTPIKGMVVAKSALKRPVVVQCQPRQLMAFYMPQSSTAKEEIIQTKLATNKWFLMPIQVFM